MTGLPINGRPVEITPGATIDDETCKALLGLELEGNKLTFGRLRHHVAQCCQSVNDYDDLEVDKICRAVALLGIETIVKQSNGGSSVDLSWLNLLRDVDDIQGKKNQQNNSRNLTLYGCVFALEMWLLLWISCIVSMHYQKKPVELNAMSFSLMVASAKHIRSTALSDMKNRFSQSDYLKLFRGLKCFQSLST